jgi:hypothetical protein
MLINMGQRLLNGKWSYYRIYPADELYYLPYYLIKPGTTFTSLDDKCKVKSIVTGEELKEA